MQTILLDTNVVSEMVRPRPDSRVVTFLKRLSEAWICSVTFYELAYGAGRAQDSRRRQRLIGWTAQIASQFEERIIVIDLEIATRAGRFRALADTQGRPGAPIDALIAAAADVKGLTLATRNTRDFEVFGIPLLNPWSEQHV